MTKLTDNLFGKLDTLELAGTSSIPPSAHMWFTLAIVAVTALVDIADSLAAMLPQEIK